MEAINGSSSQLMINAPLSSNINGVDGCGVFKECRKNHAAVLGAHAVDGCGEFMPLPNSLTCAACGCHRNFHRRVLDLFTTVVSQQPHDSRRRKRFRRKFTQVQKERMHSFSEKAGWKMQGCSEIEVEELCREIGITRGVLRVWMHNNKKKGSVIKEDTSIINESTSTSQ